jgi:redox-sensitive bicupin YhaK (pirin superfamily)
VNGTPVKLWHLVEFGAGDAVEISATTDAVLLFGHAEPLHEPIIAHGPFVMNTVEEIHQAYNDYRAGKFG